MSTVMTKTQTVKVSAISIEHAKRVASLVTNVPLSAIQNVSTLKSKSAAKSCKTDDFPVKGTRKWVTKYQVYSYGQKIPVGRNKYEYTHLELLEDDMDQKVDAVKKARELAIKYQLPMTVKIVKVLEKESNTVADVQAKTEYSDYQVTYYV